MAGGHYTLSMAARTEGRNEGRRNATGDTVTVSMTVEL